MTGRVVEGKFQKEDEDEREFHLVVRLSLFLFILPSAPLTFTLAAPALC
jgi:hypothetical protein